jgi:phage gp29-like protein
LKEKDSEQMQIINHLKNPELSESLLQQVENTLRQQLEERLMLLIGRLNIEQQITKALPDLAQSEIEKQLEPLTKQVIEKMSSVEQYQQKLAVLVQTLSTKL